VPTILIAYFLGNTSAKNHYDRPVYVKIITSQRLDVFLRHGGVIVSCCWYKFI